MEGGASLSLLAAFGLGVLHALEPAHGKPLLLLQMVSGRMNWKRSFFIISTSVIAHFLMVGSLTYLMASAFNFGIQNEIFSEQTERIIGAFSGVVLIVFGFWLWKFRHQHCHHQHGHNCKEHDHSHKQKGMHKQDFLLGLTTGIMPCPTSWVVVSNAVHAHDPFQALSWLVMFCLGMTVVLLGIGALIALGLSKISTKKLESHGFEVKLITAQAVLVILLGLFQIFNSIAVVTHSHS